MKHTIQIFFFMLSFGIVSLGSANVRMKNAENNKKISAHDRKSAFTKYFPSVSATGAGFIANNGLFELQVSRLQYNLSENEVRLTTENYFWQIITLKEKLQTLAAVETQLDRLTKDVEAAVEAGITTRNDLLQIRLRQNETQSSRIQVENALSLSRNLLAQYMGLGSDSVDVAFSMDNQLPENPSNLFENDAYKQVGIALSSIEQATENLCIQTDYYGAGTCTMSEWLDAQTLFQQSRDKYVEAYAQYEVKKREYMQATGR